MELIVSGTLVYGTYCVGDTSVWNLLCRGHKCMELTVSGTLVYGTYCVGDT